jgi:hypothetical protein
MHPSCVSSHIPRCGPVHSTSSSALVSTLLAINSLDPLFMLVKSIDGTRSCSDPRCTTMFQNAACGALAGTDILRLYDVYAISNSTRASGGMMYRGLSYYPVSVGRQTPPPAAPSSCPGDELPACSTAVADAATLFCPLQCPGATGCSICESMVRSKWYHLVDVRYPPWRDIHTPSFVPSHCAGRPTRQYTIRVDLVYDAPMDLSLLRNLLGKLGRINPLLVVWHEQQVYVFRATHQSILTINPFDSADMLSSNALPPVNATMIVFRVFVDLSAGAPTINPSALEHELRNHQWKGVRVLHAKVTESSASTLRSASSLLLLVASLTLACTLL